MKVFCLTGGIGSGKSTFASMLETQGVVRIDADAVTKTLQQPGQPVFDALVEQWGDHIVAANGELDRAALGSIVFSDRDALKRAEQIVHPAVRSAIETQLEALAATDSLVVLELPLLQPDDHYLERSCGVIVVDCPLEIAKNRIIVTRGLNEAEAQKRIEAQCGRDVRLAMADHVIDNSGTQLQLEAQVPSCLSWMHSVKAK